MQKRGRWLAGLALTLVWGSSGYAQVIGDWENGSMDGWAVSGGAPAGTTVDFSTTGVTRGASALKVTAGASGYQQVLAISLNDPAGLDAFFGNNQFDVNVTRVASEWVGATSWWNGLHLIINASSDLGGIWQDLGWSGGWNNGNGTATVTASWDYSAVKALLDRNTITYLELVIVTNFDTAFTAWGSHYLDDAHFTQGWPGISDWEDRADGWSSWGATTPFTYSATGATLNTRSLKMQNAVGGWRNAIAYSITGHGQVAQFLASDIFAVDVTRLVADWTPDPAATSKGASLMLVVNYGGSLSGRGWRMIGEVASWDGTADSTVTAAWDYAFLKADIPVDTGWLELVLVTNTWGYTGTATYYLDNARFAAGPAGRYTINEFDTAEEAAQWHINNDNLPGAVVEWDPTVDFDGGACGPDGNPLPGGANPCSGSLKVTVPWTPTGDDGVVIQRDMFPQGVDLTEYTVFEASAKHDPSSPAYQWGGAGWSNWIFQSTGWSWDGIAHGNLNNTGDRSLNDWTSYDTVWNGLPNPAPPRDMVRAIVFQLGGVRDVQVDGANGTTIFWIDNIRLGRDRSCQDPLHCVLCGDLTDTDGDGRTDVCQSENPDCHGTIYCPMETECSNGLDDDGDGLIDCADSDCAMSHNCLYHDPFADIDGDGDVDQLDFGEFQLCFTGDMQGPPAMGCGTLDRDNDADVDAMDLAKFQDCFSGPMVPADKACDGIEPP